MHQSAAAAGKAEQREVTTLASTPELGLTDVDVMPITITPVDDDPNTLLPGADQSLYFDGVDDHVRIYDDAAIDLNRDVAMEAWIYIESTDTGLHNVLVKGDGAIKGRGLFLLF